MHTRLLSRSSLASLLSLSLFFSPSTTSPIPAPSTSTSDSNSTGTLYIATCPVNLPPTEPGHLPPLHRFTLWEAAIYFSSAPSPSPSPPSPITNATGVATLAYPYLPIEGRNWTTHLDNLPEMVVTVSLVSGVPMAPGDYAGTASVGGEQMRCVRQDDSVEVGKGQGGVNEGTCESYYVCTAV